MISSVLCVCTGNICRSPVAADVLRAALPEVSVTSAGLHALVGRDTDRDAAAAARALGVTVTTHAARQFTDAIGGAADLILVMDRHHREEIRARWPHLSGKTMLLGQFENNKEIPDPYRMGDAMHFRAVEMIKESSDLWVQQITAMSGWNVRA